jgi:hypothetical protein
MVVPVVEVFGVTGAVMGVPPVATVYQFNTPPELPVAVSGLAVLFWHKFNVFAG